MSPESEKHTDAQIHTPGLERILSLALRLAIVELAVEITPTIFAIVVESTVSEKIENTYELITWSFFYLCISIYFFFKHQKNQI